MSELLAIKLHFITPVHFGRGAEEHDTSDLIYHSDSLKAAIYSVGLRIFSEWEDASLFFNGFKISSCFPYAGNEFFLPKPRVQKRVRFSKSDSDKSLKKIKKIDFLEKGNFERWWNSGTSVFEVDDLCITPDDRFLCSSRSTFTRSNGKGTESEFSFFKNEVQQRVKVPNGGEAGDSKPYYFDRMYFEDACGLYFIIQFQNETLRSQVLKALQLLGETGIGTDRSSGNGLFYFEPEKDISPFELKLTSEKNEWVSLGLFLPSVEDHVAIDFSKSQWQLVKRGGYISGSEHEEFRHLRRNTVFMFNEGSTFASTSDLVGKIIDLRPNWNDSKLHPVWRDGRCLMINI